MPTVVHYEPDIFSVPKSDFDSIPGICHSLSSLECFNEMLINRKRYLKAISQNNHSLSEYINSRYLDEFVIWKKFILDKFANIFRIESDINIPFIPDICDLDFFDLRVGTTYYLYGGALIPEADSTCPICGSKFTIYDLQNQKITKLNNKYCHTNCKQEYYRLQKNL